MIIVIQSQDETMFGFLDQDTILHAVFTKLTATDASSHSHLFDYALMGSGFRSGLFAI